MNENNNPSQNSVAILIFISFMAILLPYIFNEYVKEYYIYAWYWVSYAKFTILYHLTSLSFIRENLDNILFWVNWFLLDSRIPSEQLYALINNSYEILLNVDTTDPDTAKWSFLNGETLNESFHSVGRLGAIIYFPMYLYFGIKLVYGLMTVDYFDKVFSLDQFAQTMAEGFPELLPVVYANPLKQELDKGDWRMSPKIYQYLLENECIKEYIDDGKEMFRLNEDNLTDLLIEQLGEKWTGFGNLNQGQRTLVAVALPMVNSPANGKAEMHALIEGLGYAYSSKPTFLKCLPKGLLSLRSLLNPNFYSKKGGKKIRSSMFNDLNWIVIGYKESRRQKKYKRITDRLISKSIRRYKDLPQVKEILKHHAYNSTVIAAIIETARLGGVLPSCSCIWLKVEDRNLFYIFNNIGRHVAWVEVVGFWSHYLNEKKIKAPFPYPKIENGIEGIDDALDQSYYNYEPLIDRSQ